MHNVCYVEMFQIVSYIVKDLVIKINSSLRPENQAELEYQQLPEDYEGNERAYHSFLIKYGTHYYQMAVFGGVLFIVINHDREANTTMREGLLPSTGSINTLLQSVWLTPDDSKTNSRVLSIGGQLSTSFHSWAESVKKEPRPILGDYEPLSSLLGRSQPNPRRDQSFIECLENERRHHAMKRHMVALKKQEVLSPPQSFLLTVLENEVQFMKANTLISATSESVLTSNFEMNKWNITCHMDPFWWSK
jgi:hypothetical protein